MNSGTKQKAAWRWPTVVPCLIVATFIVSVAALPLEAQSKDVDTMVARRMAETGTPGMAVAVIAKGKVVHAKGYGVANTETQSKVTAKTVFNLASVTKSFTALAAMKLVETGRITLDDPISRHLEDIPADWKQITIRQLLNNTSGIKSFTSLADEEPCNAAQDIRTYKRGDAIKEVECFPLEFVPGGQWQYADTGFYIVGMVIEKVSGQDYGTFLKDNILSPLDMRNTKLLEYSEIVPQRANGYSFRNGRMVNASRFDIDEFANGGLVSTLEDMTRFEQAFLTEKVLRKSSIDAMLVNARLNSGEHVSNYGIGIGLTPYKGQKRFGHTGGGGLGFATAFTHFPHHNVTVVVLANADQEGIGEFANAIAEKHFKTTTKKGED